MDTIDKIQQKGYSVTGIKFITCECGHTLVLMQPEPREVLEAMGARLAGSEFSVLILEGDSAACPGCGLPLPLPPAETLDVDRNPFMRWAAENLPIRNAAPDRQTPRLDCERWA